MVWNRRTVPQSSRLNQPSRPVFWFGSFPPCLVSQNGGGGSGFRACSGLMNPTARKWYRTCRWTKDPPEFQVKPNSEPNCRVHRFQAARFMETCSSYHEVGSQISIVGIISFRLVFVETSGGDFSPRIFYFVSFPFLVLFEISLIVTLYCFCPRA